MNIIDGKVALAAAFGFLGLVIGGALMAGWGGASFGFGLWFTLGAVEASLRR